MQGWKEPLRHKDGTTATTSQPERTALYTKASQHSVATLLAQIALAFPNTRNPGMMEDSGELVQQVHKACPDSSLCTDVLQPTKPPSVTLNTQIVFERQKLRKELK